MSLVITVATTANRIRQFRQEDQKTSGSILNSLTSAAQLFQRQSLVIVGEHQIFRFFLYGGRPTVHGAGIF